MEFAGDKFLFTRNKKLNVAENSSSYEATKRTMNKKNAHTNIHANARNERERNNNIT